jgi:hypothetical protein
MIVFTVYDAREGVEAMFTNRRDAVRFAKKMSEGTEVRKVDIGKPTKQRICDCYNHEGFAIDSDIVFVNTD